MKKLLILLPLLFVGSNANAEKVDDPTFAGLVTKMICTRQYIAFCGDEGCAPLQDFSNMGQKEDEFTVDVRNMRVCYDHACKKDNMTMPLTLNSASISDGFSMKIRWLNLTADASSQVSQLGQKKKLVYTAQLIISMNGTPNQPFQQVRYALADPWKMKDERRTSFGTCLVTQ